MKYDLQDVTFLLLVKLDTIERLENVLAVLDYLSDNFNTTLTLWNVASFDNNVLNRLIPANVSYSFCQDYDPILHRTKYLNKMIRSAQTPYVAVWDVDIVVAASQVVDAVELLHNGNEVVYPYDTYFYDVPSPVKSMFYKTHDITTLFSYRDFMNPLYFPYPVGGAFIIRKETYVKSGLENEAFYGWGVEDGERFVRWNKLGLKIRRIDGPLFHLSHPRGMNSSLLSDEDSIKKKRLLYASERIDYGV